MRKQLRTILQKCSFIAVLPFGCVFEFELGAVSAFSAPPLRITSRNPQPSLCQEEEVHHERIYSPNSKSYVGNHRRDFTLFVVNEDSGSIETVSPGKDKNKNTKKNKTNTEAVQNIIVSYYSEEETYETNLKISALANQANYDDRAAYKAHKLLRQLDRPDSVTYNAVLKAYSRSRFKDAPRYAQKVLFQMETAFQQQTANQDPILVRPSSRSYTTVMHTFCRAADPDSAKNVLDKLQKAYLNTNDPNLKPSDVSYNIVISGYAKAGLGIDGALKAEQLLQQMGDLADSISYNSVINAWARSGDDNAGDRAEQIMRSMHSAGLLPNTRTYATVLDAWSWSTVQGHADRAALILNELEDLFENTKDERYRPNTFAYTAVIHAYSRSNDLLKVQKAWAILDRMKTLVESGKNKLAKPSIVTYNSILNTCARSPFTENIQLKVKSIVDQTFHDPSLQPDEYTYGTILKVCANVLCALPDTVDFSRRVFEHCALNGYVSHGVCYELRQVSQQLYRELLPLEAINPENGHFIIDNLPTSWKRNTRKRKKRSNFET